jgi:hypothetical protein
MYTHLGDTKSQEAVRAMNSDANHCRILRTDPGACEKLPEDFGEEGKKGHQCPNNPVFRHKERFEVEKKWSDIIAEALRYEGILLLNCFPTDLDEIPSIEYQIALTVRRFMEEKEMIMSQLKSPMMSFGGGGKDGNS